MTYSILKLVVVTIFESILTSNGHYSDIAFSENSTVLVTIFSNKFGYLLSIKPPQGDQAKYFIDIYRDKSLNGFYFKDFKKIDNNS